MSEADCIFCRIVAGEAPAAYVYRDKAITAFHDLHPVAPIHILVVPNRHIDSLNQIAASDAGELGRLLEVARDLACQFGVEQRGYRLVINTGADAGQSVFHLHLHLIAGRKMPFRFN